MAYSQILRSIKGRVSLHQKKTATEFDVYVSPLELGFLHFKLRWAESREGKVSQQTRTYHFLYNTSPFICRIPTIPSTSI